MADYNALGQMTELINELNATGYTDESNPFSSVTGLEGMSNLGEWEEYMSGWQTAEGKRDIMTEFGLGQGYQKYITGFQETPFEMLKSQALASLDKQSYENMKSFSGAASKIGSARAQTGMAYSGEVEGSYDRALNQAMSGQAFSKQAVTKQWEKERFTEQQRQMDTFYSDIQAAIGTQVSVNAANLAAQQKDDKTSFICGELNKVGKMTDIESLKMMKFLLKSVITHPLGTYWYITTGKFIIDEANKRNFDWTQDWLKESFVTQVIKFEDDNQHYRACSHYVNACLRLAEKLGLAVVYCDSMVFKRSMYHNIKGIFKILTHKDALRVGFSYVKTLFKNRLMLVKN